MQIVLPVAKVCSHSDCDELKLLTEFYRKRDTVTFLPDEAFPVLSARNRDRVVR